MKKRLAREGFLVEMAHIPWIRTMQLFSMQADYTAMRWWETLGKSISDALKTSLKEQ